MTHRYNPGQDTLFATDAPVGSHSAVFEDESAVTCFYAVVRRKAENQILTVLILNVGSVVDGDRDSELEMKWTGDGQTVTLLINGRPHAIFDFARRLGRHRANFPTTDGQEWITHE